MEYNINTKSQSENRIYIYKILIIHNSTDLIYFPSELFFSKCYNMFLVIIYVCLLIIYLFVCVGEFQCSTMITT